MFFCQLKAFRVLLVFYTGEYLVFRVFKGNGKERVADAAFYGQIRRGGGCEAVCPQQLPIRELLAGAAVTFEKKDED